MIPHPPPPPKKKKKKKRKEKRKEIDLSLLIEVCNVILYVAVKEYLQKKERVLHL
jgi:hypothetical protein